MISHNLTQTTLSPLAFKTTSAFLLPGWVTNLHMNGLVITSTTHLYICISRVSSYKCLNDNRIKNMLHFFLDPHRKYFSTCPWSLWCLWSLRSTAPIIPEIYGAYDPWDLRCLWSLRSTVPMIPEIYGAYYPWHLRCLSSLRSTVPMIIMHFECSL